MSSTPIESNRTNQNFDGDQNTVSVRIAELVQQSGGQQSEFLQLVGGELSKAFSLGIIAIESGQWSGPMMMVADGELGHGIDRGMIRRLLRSAAVVPVACDIPMLAEQNSGHTKTRGLHIEVSDSPSRTALLLVYSPTGIPTPIAQVSDLKLLSLYVHEIRRQIKTLANNQPLATQVSQSNALIPANNLGDRNSLQLFHQDLNLNATTYRIANESRRLLNADRVTVLLPKKGLANSKRYRVSAISGVAVVDARSNAVKCIEELTNRAAVLAKPTAFPSEDLPPQIQIPMDVYLDVSGVSGALMLPLIAPGKEEDEFDSMGSLPFENSGKVLGVIVLEYFSGDPPRQIVGPISTVSSEAVLALRNSEEHQQIFGLRVWKTMGVAATAVRSPLILLGIIAAIGLLIAGLIVQIDHQVIATGTATPAAQRQVFASSDGIVDKILVKDGQRVSAGDPLIELENAELESQSESLSGEIIAATKRIAAIEAVRLNPSGDPSQAERLVLEQRQLESELGNLNAQLELIRDQQDKLTIRSPIQGTVVAWQIQRRLDSRPVSRGNLLMTVVDHEGPWTLHLEVPDKDSGPLLVSMKETKTLPIRFAVATVPGDTYGASLESLANATRLDESGQHVIDLVAKITPGEPEADDALNEFSTNKVTVGANVTAKIACGRRSVIHSWFSDVFDFVDRNVMFYFR